MISLVKPTKPGCTNSSLQNLVEKLWNVLIYGDTEDSVANKICFKYFWKPLDQMRTLYTFFNAIVGVFNKKKEHKWVVWINKVLSLITCAITSIIQLRLAYTFFHQYLVKIFSSLRYDGLVGTSVRGTSLTKNFKLLRAFFTWHSAKHCIIKTIPYSSVNFRKPAGSSCSHLLSPVRK